MPGYPPEDLLLKRHFLAASTRALEGSPRACGASSRSSATPRPTSSSYNALAVLADGEVKASYTKMLLPNYGVFDERRYFEPGPSPALIDVNGRIVGLTICEDIWFPGAPAAARRSPARA